MLVGIFVGLAVLAGLIIGIQIGKANNKPKSKDKVLRKGVTKVRVRWWDSPNWEIANTTVVLHELERVADHSRVEIINIDDAPCDKARKLVAEQIGNYIETKNATWGDPIDYSEPEPEDPHEELDRYLDRMSLKSKDIKPVQEPLATERNRAS